MNNRLLYSLLFFISLGLSSYSQNNEIVSWLSKPEKTRESIEYLKFNDKSLTKEEVGFLVQKCFDSHFMQVSDSIKRELEKGVMHFKNYSMPFCYRYFGKRPKDGYSLFISLHGGGGCPAEVNDQQYNNQKHLYTPENSLYFVPRAPLNTWDLWHKPYMDYYLNHIIQVAVMYMGVNPNKVYIMGYSAGGDGVFQMGPRMADRWAAAAMMAGHPGDASAINLKNIGFTIHMGEKDAPYKRNKLAAKWKTKLDKLADKNKGFYKYEVQIHKGLGHWVERRDTVAVSWMKQFTRNPIPENVSWCQDNVLHKSFYWLEVDIDDAKQGGIIEARYNRKRNTVYIDKCYTPTLYMNLNDKMLDLDKKVKVYHEGKLVFNGMVERKFSTLWNNIQEKWDISFIAPAQIKLDLYIKEDLTKAFDKAGKNAKELKRAIKKAPIEQKGAIEFLVKHMPESDLKSLSADFLLKNSKWAYMAKNTFPWAKEISTSVFYNDVLPYASLNERRDEWREDFYNRFSPIVKDCKNIREAVIKVTANIQENVKVKYNTKRRKPDQSPYESMDQGMASCSGLSILLVDALRSVGIPARIAGIPKWQKIRGNHNWVEVYIDGKWYFTEYNNPKLDKSWFLERVGTKIPEFPKHQVYASSFRKTNTYFRCVWLPDYKEVPGIVVTKRYVDLNNKYISEKKQKELNNCIDLSISIFKDKAITDKGNNRIACKVKLYIGEKLIGEGISAGPENDLNDVLHFKVPKNKDIIVKYITKDNKEINETISTLDKSMNVDYFIR